MAAISHVFTITRVAEMLGEDEDLLQDTCIEMDPEDGCLTVLGPGEETITAFTRFGVDNLAELVKIYKSRPRSTSSLHANRVTSARSSPDADTSSTRPARCPIRFSLALLTSIAGGRLLFTQRLSILLDQQGVK